MQQHVFIGRSVHSTICLQDQSVSMHHLVVQVACSYHSIQLGSREARCLLNGAPLRPGRPMRLEHNDRILIPRSVQPGGGKPFYVFVFQIQKAPIDSMLCFFDLVPELRAGPVLMCLTGPAQHALWGQPISIAGVTKSCGNLGSDDEPAAEHLRVWQDILGKVIVEQVAPEGTYVNQTLLKQGEKQALADGDFLCPCKYLHKWRGSPAYIVLAGRRPRMPATPVKGLHTLTVPEVSHMGSADPELITLTVLETLEVPGPPTVWDEASQNNDSLSCATLAMGLAAQGFQPTEEDGQQAEVDCSGPSFEKRRRVAA